MLCSDTSGEVTQRADAQVPTLGECNSVNLRNGPGTYIFNKHYTDFDAGDLETSL